MKQSGTCPKCASKQIIERAIVQDRSHLPVDQRLRVITFRDPQAAFDTEPVFSSVSAWICGDCGFMELYANKPEVLKDALLNAKALEEKRKSTA